MDKVSIIVPIYKVEKYIERCVSSLMAQTYENIEIILVDDGSPDTSGMIIDEISKKDTRIKVIHKTNGGVSSARNAGISIASGEYVMFVDGDDYVDKIYVEYFVDLIRKNNSVVGMNYSNFRDDTHSRTNQKGTSTISSAKAIEDIYLGRIFVAVWNKIYNLRYIKEKEIAFNEEIWYGEGLLFNIKILKDVDMVAVGMLDVYHQVQNPDSAMRNFNLESNYCGLRSMQLQRKEIGNMPASVIKAWKYHVWAFNISIMSGIARSGSVDKYRKEYKDCASKIRRGFFVPWSVPLSTKHKISMITWTIVPYLMAYREKMKVQRLVSRNR